MIDFKNINYLQKGNPRQRAAYQLLKVLQIFEQLRPYDPLLTGTIPIDIDLPESDLDIICCCTDHEAFAMSLRVCFADQKNFRLSTHCYQGIPATCCSFRAEGFELEIFGQNIPTEAQNAYRHMLVEYEILQARGEAFREQVKQLKLAGLKTEAAFAQLLGLTGDPYEALLQLKY